MVKKKKVNNNIINRELLKVLICLFLFLLYLICNKKNSNFRFLFYDNVYNNNFSFAKINNWYESYFGNIFPINKVSEIQVFNESLVYKEKEKYKDGVLLKVRNNYIVPAISDGIVIYIGEKDGYGKTIIIEDENEIDYWYCNINIGNINIYDYVNKGDYLGEAIDGRIVMLFQKKGMLLDYNNYV